MLRRALVPLALLVACRPGSAPTDAAPAPPPQVEAAPEAPPSPAAPPAPEPATAALREAIALQPGDTRATLAADGETAVDPSARFRVVLAEPSRDARLTLYDATDAAVPASAATEIGDTTVLTLAPAAPLAPGSRYQLRLDGAGSRELHTGDRTLTPAAFLLRAAGEPPQAPTPTPHRRKRGRR
jgi:hypothetical protein